MSVPARWRWIFGGGIAALVTVAPFLAYRWEYTHAKRLREVVPGKVYRSGQMTVEGFVEAVKRYHIRTIINLQDEFPDPDVLQSYFSWRTTPESELCKRLGVRYEFLPPDLIAHRLVPDHRPAAVEHFLAIMDDPAAYPVLLHCRAGLHRTGVMTAVYRMEYDGWDKEQAIGELKANGFGEFACSSANDYITQYILTYHPGVRVHELSVADPATAGVEPRAE